jgi:hypothetical protein
MNLTDTKEVLQVGMLINYFGKKITMGKLKEKIFKLLLYFGLVWVHIALIFDVYMLYLHFTDQEAKMGLIIDKIDNYISVLR